MNSKYQRGFLLLGLVLFLLPQILGCDCQSYSNVDCRQDVDCAACQTCVSNECVEAAEQCDDAIDNDCDGLTDENCPDLCLGVTCNSPPPRSCVDGNILRYYPPEGTCVAGSCEYLPYDVECAQGCVNDACAEDACIGLYCASDDNPCTQDFCDPVEGCQYLPWDGDCDDADACTEGDTCQDGLCESGSQVNCNDEVHCTEDTCTPEFGCLHAPRAALCDDSDPCTDDACAAVVGCTHTFNSDPCDDQDPCTMQDICSQGLCAGMPLDSDGDGHQPISCGGQDCDDNDPDAYPGAEEVCDGDDDNCDGLIDMVGRDYCDYDAMCQAGELVQCPEQAGPIDVQRVIDENTLWCAKNSPIIHSGLTVMPATTLTVGPCVEVRAEPDACIDVRGTLEALGVDSAMTVFTSNSDTPSRGDWCGIQIGKDDASPGRATLRYATVEYSVEGFSTSGCGPEPGCEAVVDGCLFFQNESSLYDGRGRVHIESSEFVENGCGTDGGHYTFDNCVFRGNDVVGCRSANMKFYDCEFLGNVEGLLGVDIVQGCTFSDTVGTAINSRLRSLDVTQSVFVGNGQGIVLSDHFVQQAPISGNTFCDNLGYALKLESGETVDATNNWWCTTDPEQIATDIHDLYDENGLGVVIFEPFLLEAP
jgi:hypothetical protein